MPRQASKCREWEKDRRDRLNNSFSELSKKLPCYQPSLNISKIEILHKATAYIDELDGQVKDLLANNASKTTCEKIKKLRDQIKKLLIRNEQLCNLLKDAGIRYPSECGLVRFKTPKKWTNKISPDQAKVLAEKEAQKENKNSNAVKDKKSDKTKRKKNVLRSVQKARVKRKEHKKLVQSAFRLNIAQSNLLSLVTTQSCFIITNTPKVCQSNVSKATTDSRILSTPLPASHIKPTGTVFVANNNILPFIHQPALVPTPILASNPIIVNSSLPRSNHIVPTILTNTSILVNTTISNGIPIKINQNNKVPVTNSVSISETPTTTRLNLKSNNVSTSVNLPKIATKSLPPLRPKAYTRTTQVNKVPIPALSSEYSKCLLKSLKLTSSSSSTNPIKTYVNKRKEVDKIGSSKKGIIIKQNIVLNNNKEEKAADNCKKDNDTSLEEKKEKQKQIDKVNENDVIEPSRKKIKLDEESSENKKVPTTLTYSIDALCNDIPESITNTNTILEASSSNKSEEAASMEKIENQSKINESDAKKSVDNGAKEINKENHSVTDSGFGLNSVSSSQKENEIQEKKEDTVANPNTSKEVDVKVSELNDALGHSELSNDIFASLSHVAAGGQNPESTSPTAAFLLAFPLVSSLNSLKVTEVIEDEATESQRGTPTLLQIGTMDTTKTTQSQSDTLTPSLLNLDNFSFFPKEFYPSFDIINTTGVNTNNTDNVTTLTSSTITSTAARSSDTNETITINNNIVNVADKPSRSSLQRNDIPITTVASNNSNINSSSSNSMTANISQNKNISKKESIEVSKSLPSQVYTNTETEKTYSTSNTSLIKPETSQKMDKPPDVHVMTSITNYTSPSANYNFPYNNSFFSSNETVPSNTVSISTEKEKQKPEKKTSCYYPTSTSYSLANVTSNYSLPTVTPASYSLPIVATAPYSVTVTTASYSLPAVTTISQYNTFNPFTDLPAKTSSYIPPKSYNEMLYTNNSYTHSYGDNLNITHANTKSSKDKNYYGFNYDSYEYKEFQKPYEPTRNQPNQTYCYNSNQSTHQGKEKQGLKTITNNANNNSNNTTNTRQPVNWMTTPDVRQQPQDFIPFSKEMEFVPSTIYSSFSSVTQNSYFNNNSYTTGDFHTTFPESRKIDTFPPIPNSFQRSEEENQFSWSPSKLPHMLDAQHSFMSNTLPTLVGDLALGTQPMFPQQKEKIRSKDVKRNKLQTNFDSSQNNFLSVSQLVDHNKTINDGSTNPNRITHRRSSGSGNRTSSKTSSNKATKRCNKNDNSTKEIQTYGNKSTGNENKQQIKHQGNQNEYHLSQNNNNDWLINNNKNRNVKNPSSSYSAEALIGHQNTDIGRHRNQQNYNPIVNKSLPVSFLAENLLPYFPPVDIPQESNLLPQNQNYHQSGSFGHNFASTIQNNVYTNNTFVPTNFNLPDIGGNPTEYNAGIIDNTFAHGVPRPPEKFNKPKNTNLNDRQEDKRTVQSNNNNNSCSLNQLGTPKKSKKKQHETTLPGLVDFAFLPMPGAINSPILPDDFHSHTNFLPPPPTPTQLYPCKNPLYSKQAAELSHNPLLPLPPVTRPGVAHPEISPSLNSVGSSLTNFNLSTIFPEINKDYTHRDYLGAAPQVSFPKTNPPIGYIHSTSANT